MTATMIGRVFNNRYQITERIGIGGMAEVYRAQDTVLGRTVAIKVMLPQYAADPAFTQRFKQEAASAANLESPYIVNIYDWGQDEGTYYIVMEYVRGSDLKTGIIERGAINQRKVAEIGSQVCRALSVAHKLDIIHRDIKPQNIMVQPDGNVKVMDFGIARAKNSVRTQTSSVLGTAHYISPEQAQGKDLTATSDIYSLGIVLYEAATGSLPFDGPDAVSVAMKQVNEEPPMPSSVNPAIDPSLEAIIMKAMAKDPRDRFATANEMRLELNNFLAGRPVNVAGAGAFGYGAAETSVMGNVGATNVMGGMNAAGGMGRSNADSTSVMPAGMGQMKPVDAAAATYRQPSGGDAPKKSKKGLIIALVAVLAVLVLGGAAFALLSGGGSGDPVPNVVGKSLDEATKEIENAGFVVGKVDKAHSDSAEKDEVTSQDPAGGKKREKGTKINLVVSLGAEEVVVPNLTNMTAEQAQAELAKYGLTAVAGNADYSSDVEAKHIMSQSPEANTIVKKGSTVTYVLSLGTEVLDVPNVVNYTQDEAMNTLKSAGFKVEVQTEESETVSKGYVIRQNPSSGKLDKGDTVTIVVSNGAPKPTTVTVPNVMGYMLADAKAELEAAGFTVTVSGSSDGRATVVQQSPTGSVEQGATITLTTKAPESGGSGGGTNPSAS